MLQVAAVVLCGFLGWQRAPFQRWPIAIIIFVGLAGIGMVMAGHHAGAGPALDEKLLSAAVSLLLFPAAAYWLLYAGHAGLDRLRR